MSDALFDVVGVNLKTSKVRIMGKDQGREDAEAFVKMAVIRRGVDVEFFSVVPCGKYRDGDSWKGNGRSGADRKE